MAANAFVDCQNVRVIDLRRNSMATLNTDSFKDLPQVRVSCFGKLKKIKSYEYVLSNYRNKTQQNIILKIKEPKRWQMFY